MSLHLEFSFLSNKEKSLLMMAPPIYKELYPYKSEILSQRKLMGNTDEIILKVSDEIDRIIKNRSTGYPTRMKKPTRRSKPLHTT